MAERKNEFSHLTTFERAGLSITKDRHSLKTIWHSSSEQQKYKITTDFKKGKQKNWTQGQYFLYRSSVAFAEENWLIEINGMAAQPTD
jgi:hypothetical protein